MDRASILKSGTILLLALASAAATAQRMEQLTLPAVGSSFIYQRSDSGSYGAATSDMPNRLVAFAGEGGGLVSFEAGGSHFVVRPENGDLVGFAGPDQKMVVSFAPPLALVVPLEVGKTWTRQHQMKLHASDRMLPYEVTVTVQAFEEVAVPAGRFPAWRMRFVDSAGNDNLEWLSPDLGVYVKRVLERTDRHAQGAGRRELLLKSHDIHR